MKLLYIIGFSDWWGAYPPDILDREDGKTVGGGEAGALQTAFQLAALGHDVTYLSVASPGVHKGVIFRSGRDTLHVYLEGAPWDAILCWSTAAHLSLLSGDEPVLFVQQLNDLSLPWGWWNYVDVLVSPSWTHAAVMGHYLPQGVGLAQHVVGNGVDLTQFPWPSIPPSERPMQVGWWSSPDRGLHHLLRAWPLIKQQVPSARLRIFYQVKKYIDESWQWGGRPSLIGRILEKALIETRSLNVELIDQIPRRALARHQQETRVQAYPCDPEGFTEGFATSILEALSAGCLTVTRRVDALPELWDGVVSWIDAHPSDPAFIQELADKVAYGLTTWAANPTSPTLDEMRSRAERWPWSAVGKQIEAAIHDAIWIRTKKQLARRAENTTP